MLRRIGISASLISSLFLTHTRIHSIITLLEMHKAITGKVSSLFNSLFNFQSVLISSFIEPTFFNHLPFFQDQTNTQNPISRIKPPTPSRFSSISQLIFLVANQIIPKIVIGQSSPRSGIIGFGLMICQSFNL